MMTIQQRLFVEQDLKYRDFHAALIPNIDKITVIGVRVPKLRNIAREIMGTEEAKNFLCTLPHQYYEENQLHAILLGEVKDYEECLKQVNVFLPYIDNWATCDILRPKCFAQYHWELIKEISIWLKSGKTYIVRFGIEMLMLHFLVKDFQVKYLQFVAQIRSEEYYLRMMQAWFFAEALVKQWDASIKFIEDNKLEIWTHNKAIQKACESFRISEEKKEYLRGLKRR